MSEHKMIKPARGYSNGVVASPGRTVFVAGQIGWNADQKLVSYEFVPQFEQALANVVEIVKEAGGEVLDLCRFTIFVTDKAEYVGAAREVGEVYRKLMGKHFPAMSLVEVKGLLEPGAKVEIEATAVIGSGREAQPRSGSVIVT